MNEILDLIEKHRPNGLLIDANLLILCLIGRLNRRRIANFERTSSFSEDDYETLERLISEFRFLNGCDGRRPKAGSSDLSPLLPIR